MRCSEQVLCSVLVAASKVPYIVSGCKKPILSLAPKLEKMAACVLADSVTSAITTMAECDGTGRKDVQLLRSFGHSGGERLWQRDTVPGCFQLGLPHHLQVSSILMPGSTCLQYSKKVSHLHAPDQQVRELAAECLSAAQTGRKRQQAQYVWTAAIVSRSWALVCARLFAHICGVCVNLWHG